jgi:hypothetical protein
MNNHLLLKKLEAKYEYKMEKFEKEIVVRSELDKSADFINQMYGNEKQNYMSHSNLIIGSS